MRQTLSLVSIREFENENIRRVKNKRKMKGRSERGKKIFCCDKALYWEKNKKNILFPSLHVDIIKSIRMNF